jgi:uncharacterized protein YuzE
MKITYDSIANAAYIYLSATGEKIERTYTCDPVEIDGLIALDFDARGRLVGIEVLDASRKLPETVLKAAEIIG